MSLGKHSAEVPSPAKRIRILFSGYKSKFHALFIVGHRLNGALSNNKIPIIILCLTMKHIIIIIIENDLCKKLVFQIRMTNTIYSISIVTYYYLLL